MTPTNSELEDIVIKFVPPTNMMSGEQKSNRQLAINQLEALINKQIKEAYQQGLLTGAMPEAIGKPMAEAYIAKLRTTK